MNAPEHRPVGVITLFTVAGIACAAFFLGFYILPGAGPPATLWQRMCRAAGYVPAAEQSVRWAALPAAYTTVVTPHAAMRIGTPEEVGRGATLALRCTACHGARGLSGADAPNLAGQYSEVIYKQLVDFRRGARLDAVMGAMVATLTDGNMLDLSHYYAGLTRPKDEQLASAPALIRVGDPMRNIAPCASCHGRLDGKVGAPALEGEPKAYLEKQLKAFANGTRRNDANAAMRNEARLLSQTEINALTDHYAQASL
jgi:cytochrome c553